MKLTPKPMKTVRKAKGLIWIIPMLTTASALVGFLGLGYAALIQWMRTMALERRALRLAIEEAQARRDAPRAEGD